MKVTIIICSVVLLVFLFLKSSFSSVFEGVSVLLFRLGFSFLVLFGVHLLLGMIGYTIPINLFTGAVVAILGVPGVASVVAISIFI